MSEVEWGTEEYFEQRGEKRGIKIGENRIIKKIIESFKKRGMSKEEIQDELKEFGISYEQFRMNY